MKFNYYKNEKCISCLQELQKNIKDKFLCNKIIHIIQVHTGIKNSRKILIQKPLGTHEQLIEDNMKI